MLYSQNRREEKAMTQSPNFIFTLPLLLGEITLLQLMISQSKKISLFCLCGLQSDQKKIWLSFIAVE